MKLKEILSSVGFVLALMFVMRLATLGFPALVDTTDARYASIAANMATGQNSVVPFVHQDGQVMGYWSKPPLAFWLQASSIDIFGLNEWAVRLPGLLWLSLAVALTAWLAARWIGPEMAGITAVLTASATLMFVLASVTMTDQPLVAALVGAMISFGVYFENAKANWARIGFGFLGLALLAKGPVGLMMPAASLGAYVLISNSWGKLFKIPWGNGILVMLAVAAPWYLLMEQQEPGFIKYFLMDENFNRLISGDLKLRHGSAHPTFRGVAFLCFIVVTIPWLVIPFWMASKKGARALLPVAQDKLANPKMQRELYLLLWFAAPLLPLAVGEQVLPYYLLPLTPGFILWLVMVAKRLDLLHQKTWTFTAAICSIVCSVAMLIMGPLFLDAKRSTRPIIEELVRRVGDTPVTVAFGDRVPDSGYFYQGSKVSASLRFVSLPLAMIRSESPTAWVIARTRDVKDSDNAGLPGYEKRITLKKWTLFERKSPA